MFVSQQGIQHSICNNLGTPAFFLLIYVFRVRFITQLCGKFHIRLLPDLHTLCISSLFNFSLCYTVDWFYKIDGVVKVYLGKSDFDYVI